MRCDSHKLPWGVRWDRKVSRGQAWVSGYPRTAGLGSRNANLKLIGFQIIAHDFNEHPTPNHPPVMNV